MHLSHQNNIVKLKDTNNVTNVKIENAKTLLKKDYLTDSGPLYFQRIPGKSSTRKMEMTALWL